LPGEVVVDYALRLKKELNGSRIWMNAYTNACPGYVPSERILREGGYEGGGAMVYYDIPSPYATGLEQVIVETVERQLKDKILPVANAKKTDAKADKTDGIQPLSPSEAVSSLRTKPGFHAELVASEPMIESPVAISFGPDGQLWVAEMSDYPQGGAESGGRIRCLHDDNDDGRYDRSEVFMSGLAYPTGVTVWRNGILVCAAPDILYAEDTNNDGKADRVETLFTGFATHNYQARVNSLEYGLDGWVYGSCGLFGGEITSVKTGEVIALGQRDFRINPDSGALEPATGATQQGRVRNDWGDWFGCNNGTMLMHYPLANEYLRRNPYLAPQQTVVGIAAQPDAGRLYSISNQVLFMLSGPPNRPTAACGLGIYRDDALGADYRGDTFTCEPVNNLVHRQHLAINGVSFTSRRQEDELNREFLASTDPWFRPVQVHTGIDGALWVVDMYRYVIEHPIWIPPDTLATLDTRAGANMGRIYRVVADNASMRKAPRLSSLRGEQLAAAMDVSNGVQRDLVQQLIQWNHDTEAAKKLQSLALESSSAEVRVQALSTLANIQTPPVDLLTKMMTDADPHVRRHAVRIAESQLSQSAELAATISTLTLDDDAFVRLQVAYSAAALEPSASAKVLVELMASDSGNVHIVSAVESSLSAKNLAQILSQSDDSMPKKMRDRLLANVATLADGETLRNLLQKLSQAAIQPTSASAAVENMNQLAQFVDAWSHRSEHQMSPRDESVQIVLRPLMERAISIAANEEDSVQLRMAAIRMLAQGPFLGEPHLESLTSLLTSRTAPELQSAVIVAMRKDARAEVADKVLADWATREPRLRKETIAMLLSRPQWAEQMLEAIRRGTVSPGELELPQQQLLLDHADETIRTAAAETFKRKTSAERQQIVDRYAAAVTNSGDAGRGRLAFQKHCSTCHKLQDIGHIVGPDIAGYSGKPLQSLLIAMLDPNQAVDPRYQAYAVALHDGRSLSGLIAEENASSLILLAAEGKRETVLRSEIEEIRSTGKSLMPEGLEQKATTDDVNDLWAFFRTMQLPPKTLPGNTPKIVEIPTEGNVALLASQAEIYGNDITFESPYQNIGYWHNVDDHVRWRIHSPSGRNVQIWAEWSCDDGAAGSSFSLQGTEPVLKGTVGTTGGWDRYQLVRLGLL
jgi:putative membrane-bound dehydrogenase-like protein